ncbi:MAG: ABC transporter substrate-binding protein [Usitatibacter sp.]
MDLSKIARLAATALLLAAPASAWSAEKVILTLNFTPYGLHFGPVMAKEKGLYAKEGLEVEILRGYGSGESVKRAALGTTTFAMADAASVIFGRDKGLGTRQIATILDKSSDAVYYRKAAGIKSPKDLEGKQMGAATAESHLMLWPVFAKKAGVDASKVQFVTMTSPAKIPSLMVGKIDAMMTFVTEEPNIASAGIKANAEWGRFLFADYGVENYSIGLIASDELMKSNPALVKKFVNATMAGYALAIADPEGAANAFVKHFPETTRDMVLAQWKIVSGQLYTDVAKQKGLGYMTEAKMAATIDLIKANSKLEKDIKPADVFTMEFLQPQFPPK